VVYATAPLNLLAWIVFVALRDTTKILDVVDIWPDVLPFSPGLRRTFAPFFAAWKRLFVAGARRSDVLLAVSDDFLAEAARYVRTTTPVRRFYIGHESLLSEREKQPLFTVVYVGNIGWLYDFESLLDVLSEETFRESMQLFVIGTGDRREWLVDELRRRRIRHQYFGVVRERERLAEILCSCHAGFNGFVKTTASFSYKAGSYLAAGLPLVNSMPGDLERIILDYGVGENYRSGDRAQLKDALLRLQQKDTEEIRARCTAFFKTHLDSARIHWELVEFLSDRLEPLPVRLAALRGRKREMEISS